jgi:hypothetical protein
MARAPVKEETVESKGGLKIFVRSWRPAEKLLSRPEILAAMGIDAVADDDGGVVTFGLSRKLVRDLYAAWPDAGFHKTLVCLELKRLRTHPWSPLPMVRL